VIRNQYLRAKVTGFQQGRNRSAYFPATDDSDIH
jgi:hypothetical protein